MEFRTLGRTDIKVTSVCLGTMTWGKQNTESEAHEQLDYALSRGINFIDTAEMYPVPGEAKTQGRTEAYIGSWIAERKNRDKYVGRTARFPHLGSIATVIITPQIWCRWKIFSGRWCAMSKKEISATWGFPMNPVGAR